MFFRSLLFCFKQKTAYEMRISDWSSDVCSSDLLHRLPRRDGRMRDDRPVSDQREIGRQDPALHADIGCVPAVPARRAQPAGRDHSDAQRSEERRVGKECVSTCRSRWSPYPYKKNKNKSYINNMKYNK